MYVVEAEGGTKEYSEKEFLQKFGLTSKQELYKSPFTKHILIEDGKTINVEYVEDTL